MLTWLLLCLPLALAADKDAFATWVDRLPHPSTELDVADGYRFQHQVFGEIAEAVAESPGLVEVESIGTTHANRPIWAFHVTEYTRPVERKVLVFAGIHALEWISTEVATSLLVDLIAHPVEGTAVTVIPILNPDGRVKVEGDLAEGVLRYRRGNLPNVDLNRDFAVNSEAKALWKAFLPGYYATSTEPLSQPETRALDALAARECYARAASLHAFGGFLYYPWSGRWQRPPHRKQFVELGRAMEKAQGSRAYKTRQLARWGFFFRAQGSEIDHLYGRYGTRAFLVELTRSGIRPFRPKTWRNKYRWYNPVDPAPHVSQGLEAMRALIHHPPLPDEPSGAACGPPLPDAAPLGP
ncbi:MAG: hypothetical protein JRI25_04260 [Deltaproteobacteria bacterium]|nr:hypothetical protein [Deltaproteobacteria bacterium]MBW2253793.1 hypothetical protein [Deltaproteobacteria bacterium]